MINNFLCEDCQHYFVCEKLKAIRKFDTEDKNWNGIDITMDACRDYFGPEKAGAHE